MIGPDLFCLEALWRHDQTFRRHERGTANAVAFEIDLEANLLALQRELQSGSYRPGPVPVRRGVGLVGSKTWGTRRADRALSDRSIWLL